MHHKRQTGFFQSRLGLLTVLLIVGFVLVLYTYSSGMFVDVGIAFIGMLTRRKSH